MKRASVLLTSAAAAHGPSIWFDRYVSRDRNIVQFYGACVQENNLLLVAEMMEVLSLAASLTLLHFCAASDLLLNFLLQLLLYAWSAGLKPEMQRHMHRLAESA